VGNATGSSCEFAYTQADVWGACSASCGNGTQTRNYLCFNAKTNTSAPASNCSTLNARVESQACYLGSCCAGVTCYNGGTCNNGVCACPASFTGGSCQYAWALGNVSAGCNSTCGAGSITYNIVYVSLLLSCLLCWCSGWWCLFLCFWCVC